MEAGELPAGCNNSGKENAPNSSRAEMLIRGGGNEAAVQLSEAVGSAPSETQETEATEAVGPRSMSRSTVRLRLG